MQYTPLAIATVATESAQGYVDSVPSRDRELVARVWADLTQEIVFDPILARLDGDPDAFSWDLVIRDVMDEFEVWLERHALSGSLVERVGRAVLDACDSFVNLER